MNTSLQACLSFEQELNLFVDHELDDNEVPPHRRYLNYPRTNRLTRVCWWRVHRDIWLWPDQPWVDRPAYSVKVAREAVDRSLTMVLRWSR